MSAPEYHEVVADLAAERRHAEQLSTLLAETTADVAALRDAVEAEQVKRIDLQGRHDKALTRERRLQAQIAEMAEVLAAGDETASTCVVPWPIGRQHADWYQLERGPFPSELEACIQLLLACGAYPDTPEGYGDAAAFMVRRTRTRAEQANEIARHPSIDRRPEAYQPPEWAAPVEVTPEVAPEAWDDVLRRWS